MKNPQPMQPVVKDENGILRFRENAIVRYLLDRATAKGVTDLNRIAMRGFSQEDQEQFAQLIGYSITGYHELSYVSDESATRASALAHAVDPTTSHGCRETGCPIHGGGGK